MAVNKKPPSEERKAQLMHELHRDVALRQQGYRERALKVLPHICASCGREFSGTRLRELTVHHKDHNYKNNPPDGSNWELLCLYCHDHEHEKYKMADHAPAARTEAQKLSPSIFSQFSGLDALIKPESDKKPEDETPQKPG